MKINVDLSQKEVTMCSTLINIWSFHVDDKTKPDQNTLPVPQCHIKSVNIFISFSLRFHGISDIYIIYNILFV
jgi:hypothetical protein